MPLLIVAARVPPPLDSAAIGRGRAAGFQRLAAVPVENLEIGSACQPAVNPLKVDLASVLSSIRKPGYVS